MLRKILATGLAMSAIDVGFGQDSVSKSSLAVSGSADIYYKYDLGHSRLDNLTSFTHSHNSFELGMATVKLDYKTAKVEMVADLGFGKRAQEFSYNDEGILAAVKQLYISYSPADWIKLTAGSWATHVGYELVDAAANRNYSMSYMFTNGPFFHTGLKAELAYGKSGFMIGIANPTDFKYVPDGVINKKFLLAQYSYAPSDGFKAYLNYVGGQNIDTSKTYQLDLVLATKPTGKLSVAFDGTYAGVKQYMGNKEYDINRSWWAAAVYLAYDPTNRFGLALREEYFSDKDGLKVPALTLNGHIVSSTLSANFRVDNFLFIPEVRVDHADREIFWKKGGSSTATSANILFAAIYSF